jgi:hypothetical protein
MFNYEQRKVISDCMQYDICSAISSTRIDAVNENKIIEICRITKKRFGEYQRFFCPSL